jgi:hypothetical protein
MYVRVLSACVLFWADPPVRKSYQISKRINSFRTQISPRSQVLEMPIVALILQIPAFYGTQSFITAITVFWDDTVQFGFGKTCCLPPRAENDDVNSWFLQYVGIYLPNCTASHPGRLYSPHQVRTSHRALLCS